MNFSVSEQNNLSEVTKVFNSNENSILRLYNILKNYNDEQNSEKFNFVFLFYYKGEGITTILKTLSNGLNREFASFDNELFYYPENVITFLEDLNKKYLWEIKGFENFQHSSFINYIINSDFIKMKIPDFDFNKLIIVFPIEAPVNEKYIEKYTIEELRLLVKQKNKEKEENNNFSPDYSWDLITETNTVVFKKLKTNNLLSIIKTEMNEIIKKNNKNNIIIKSSDLELLSKIILLSKGYPTLKEISGLGKMLINNLINLIPKSDRKNINIKFDISCKEISNILKNIEEEAEKLENTNSKLYYEYSFDEVNEVIKFEKFEIKMLMVAKNKNLYTYQDIKFDDVIGHEEVKQRFTQILEYFKDPGPFKKYELYPPLKILLYGPPGTGKTMLAKSLAGESGLPFFAFSTPEITNQKYAGWGALTLRQIFKDVESYSPCILFFDEIDAIANRNSIGSDGASIDQKSILNTFLTLVDGISSRSDLILIAATNRLQDLDEALIRPGRFGTKIFVGALSKKGRKEFIQKKIKKEFCVTKEYDDIIEKIVGATRDISNASEIQGIIDEIKLYFIKKGKERIDLLTLNNIIDEFIHGEKINIQLDEVQKNKTSYHESGHAIIVKSLIPNKKIERISIGYRKTTLGFTELSIEDESNFSNFSFNDIIIQIIILMGGIAAEKIKFGNWDIGSSNDFSKVSELAKLAVTNYDLNVGLDTIIASHLNDKQNDLIHEYVITLIEFCIDTAKNILNSNYEILDDLAQILLEKEELDKQETEDFFTKHKNKFKQFYISDIVEDIQRRFLIKYKS